jgi:hypothetical protein
MDEIDKMGGMNDMDETWQYYQKFQHKKNINDMQKLNQWMTSMKPIT